MTRVKGKTEHRTFQQRFNPHAHEIQHKGACIFNTNPNIFSVYRRRTSVSESLETFLILFIIFVIQINLFIRQSKIHALVKVHIKNTNRQLFRNFNRFQQRFRISFGYPFVEITYIQLFIKMYRIIIPYFSDSSFKRGRSILEV